MLRAIPTEERALRLPGQRILLPVLIGGTLALGLHYWAGVAAGGGERLGESVSSVVVATAALACLLRSRRALGMERYAWSMLGVAVLAWAASDAYTVWLGGGPAQGFSVVDGILLPAYGMGVVGLVLLMRSKIQDLDWLIWMDGLIAALGTAALGTAVVFDSLAAKVSAGGEDMVATLAYPLGDILLLSLAVGAIALTGWRPGRIGLLLANAIVLLLIADISLVLQAGGDPAAMPAWIEPIYVFAAVLLGAAAWQPTDRRIDTLTTSYGRRELAVPIIFAVVVGGLFLLQYISEPTALSTALRMVTVLAIVARLAVSTRENRLLLKQVRTDQLTQLGNRSRLETDLERSCAKATADGPVGLVLFDLNGFKDYNDRFGHPAGDALLRALGRDLRRAVAGDGQAYRVGGDEFCLLLTCDPDRFQRVVTRARRALSASERGLEVSASHGTALIPAEAGDPLAALQLADARMYADKEARRGANGFLPPGVEPRATEPLRGSADPGAGVPQTTR